MVEPRDGQRPSESRGHWTVPVTRTQLRLMNWWCAAIQPRRSFRVLRNAHATCVPRWETRQPKSRMQNQPANQLQERCTQKGLAALGSVANAKGRALFARARPNAVRSPEGRAGPRGPRDWPTCRCLGGLLRRSTHEAFRCRVRSGSHGAHDDSRRRAGEQVTRFRDGSYRSTAIAGTRVVPPGLARRGPPAWQVSVAESLLVRNALRPLTIPLKLWVTWQIVRSTK